jgi:hypothetical protein
VASEQASKGLGDLINRARSLSLNQADGDIDANANANADADADGDAAKHSASSPQEQSTNATLSEEPKEVKEVKEVKEAEHPDRPESLPADIVKEAGSILSRFQIEAKKRLMDIEKVEDAADDALLRFGNNIRTFLKDAVSIAPPTEFVDDSQPNKVLFESKDTDGKRVIHTTRLDAQLHVIHCSLDSFLKDPSGAEYEEWSSKFDADTRTDDISAQLEKYPELRRAMEKLVPEQVDFVTFWRRYYFLKGVAELEEKRRKELLKGTDPLAESGEFESADLQTSGAASNADEEVAWDEDSDEDDSNTPNAARSTTTLGKPIESSATGATLKPFVEPRKSNDQHSQADSDASYDVVSGATSRTPGSPRVRTVDEESDEEDWE